jgi:Sulfotransferase domain
MDGSAKSAPLSCRHLAGSSLLHRPDFLVISPPKTGSTWLADNFRHHPRLFVPAIKEVKYFSCFCNWLDLGWYLDHFRAARGVVKGEASPSYAILPPERIRLVRELLPDVKLIFLMRDPIARAWSHARHNFRYREARFADCHDDFDGVPESHWREAFRHEWILASGDYLSQLRRWLEVFPQEQLLVGFYESIAAQPAELLRRIFGFLGVDPALDLDSFPLHDRILPGIDKPLPPALRADLHGLLHERSRELAAFVKSHFDLVPPPAWDAVLEPATDRPRVTSVSFDDEAFQGVCAQEEDFPGAHLRLIEDYRGYEVAYFRRRLLAVDRAMAPPNLGDAAALERHHREGHCFSAGSMPELQGAIDQHLFAREVAHLRAVEEQLARSTAEVESRLTRLQSEFEAREAADRQRIAALERSLYEAGLSVQHLEAQVIRLRPWHRVVARIVRNGWRRFRAWLRADRGPSAALETPGLSK